MHIAAIIKSLHHVNQAVDKLHDAYKLVKEDPNTPKEVADLKAAAAEVLKAAKVLGG